MRRIPAVLTALVLLLPLAACGGEEGGAADRVGDVVRQAIEDARERRNEDTGGQQAQEVPDRNLGTDARSEFDYATYQQTLETTFGLLERYWSQALPALGGEWSKPSRYVYYRSDQGAGPRCGEQAAPPNNAFYCPAGDFIAWDETGLLIPYYVQGGDFASAFVLAHEYGHAMQMRLPRQEQTGVLRELQADCYAGAWSAWVSDQDLLAAGDLDEATLAVFSGRDLPGTPWTEPAAHGSGFERTRAFGDGFESGPSACYPAPADDWIVARG